MTNNKDKAIAKAVKELQSKVMKEIDKIEIEYPDDNGEPFEITAEDFKEELKQNLNKNIFENGN